MKTIKKIFLSILAMTMITSMVSCKSKSEDASSKTKGETKASSTNSTLEGPIALNGSTSMEKMIGALSEAFMLKNPEVSITYDPTGSGSGISSVTNGTTDIGLSSRNLKKEETGLEGTIIAYDGIAIIVNSKNPVKDLSLEQIKALFQGDMTSWSEVGGADKPVVIIGREAGSGTRDGFESIVKVEDKCKYVQELTSTGAVMAAVKANENAIGYISLSAVNDEIGVLAVEGVVPTEATILDTTYPIQRPFIFVTSESTKLSPQSKAFLEFCLSDEAEKIISDSGVVQAS